jgi:hypothetical protein
MELASKRGMIMRRLVLAVLPFCLAAMAPARSGQQPQRVPLPEEYREVVEYLTSRVVDYRDGVLRIYIPRDDLKITVRGETVPSVFGFEGWIAMTKGEGGNDLMMGDLVVLQDEVNRVLSSLVENGLEVTALDSHFFWDEPRLFDMRVRGEGKASDLARRIKPGLELIGVAPGAKPAGLPVVPAAGGPLTTARLAQIVGRPGESVGPVFKIKAGRDEIRLTDAGALIGERMGLGSRAAFFGSDMKAMIAGDIAALETEVTPVLKALRAHGLDVIDLDEPFPSLRPTVVSIRFWGQGEAAPLAEAFRAALDATGGPRSVR